MNALKISLRFVRSPSLLSNELRQLSVKSNLANFQLTVAARNYSQISLQKVSNLIGVNISYSVLCVKQF